MELHQLVGQVKSKDDLVNFIAALRSDLECNESEWENPTLDRFLRAMEDWIGSMDNYYRNTGQEIPSVLTWKNLADILYASKIYE